LRACLQRVLNDASSGGQPVPLSNMKRLFRSKFHVELSETALGYAKVSELLQDPRVSDLCEVKLQGHGYVMMPAKPKTKRSLISLSESLCVDDAATNVPSSATLGIDCGSLLRKRAGFVQPLCMDEILSEESSPRASTSQASPSLCVSSAQAQPLLATTPARTPFPPTPSPTVQAQSLPRLLGATRRRPQALPSDLVKGGRGLGGEGGSPKFAAATKTAEVAAATGRNALAAAPAPSVRLCDSVAKDRVPGSRRARRPSGEQPWQLPPLTPSTLGACGFSVQNTFIHAAMPPPTPMRVGSQHRARSLPRNTC